MINKLNKISPKIKNMIQKIPMNHIKILVDYRRGSKSPKHYQSLVRRYGSRVIRMLKNISPKVLKQIKKPRRLSSSRRSSKLSPSVIKELQRLTPSIQKVMKNFGYNLPPAAFKLITNETIKEIMKEKPNMLEEIRKISVKTIHYLNNAAKKGLSKDLSPKNRERINRYSKRLIRAIKAMTPRTLNYITKIRDTPRYIKDIVRKIPTKFIKIIKNISLKDILKIRKILLSNNKKLLAKHSNFLGDYSKNVLDIIKKVNPVILIKLKRKTSTPNVRNVINRLSPLTLRTLKSIDIADLNNIRRLNLRSATGKNYLDTYPPNVIRAIKSLPYKVVKYIRSTPKNISNKVVDRLAYSVKNDIKVLSPSVIKRIREYKSIPQNLLTEKETNFLNRYSVNLIKSVATLPIKVIKKIQRHNYQSIVRRLSYKIKDQIKDISNEDIRRIKGLSLIPRKLLTDSEKEFLSRYNRKITNLVVNLPMKRLIAIKISAMPVNIKEVVKRLPKSVYKTLDKLYIEEINKIRNIISKPLSTHSETERSFLNNYSTEVIDLIQTLHPKVVSLIKIPVRLPTPPLVIPPKPLSPSKRRLLLSSIKSRSPRSYISKPSIPSYSPRLSIRSHSSRPSIPSISPPFSSKPTSPVMRRSPSIPSTPPPVMRRSPNIPSTPPPVQKLKSEFVHMGCFNDNFNRSIKRFVGNVRNKDECHRLAEKNGADVFGLQYNGQCFVGKHKVDSHYSKYGAKKYCPSLGGAWSQQVFLKKSVAESEKKKYKEQEVKRASEKAKREYERSVKIAAEKSRLIQQANLEKERALKSKLLEEKDKINKLKNRSSSINSKVRELLKKAELEFDPKKVEIIKKNAANLQKMTIDINRKVAEAKLKEEINKNKIDQLKIKADYDLKSAMARELIKKAEEIKNKVASDMNKINELKKQISINSSVNKTELQTKIVKLEAKAIAAARNANELKKKSEMDIKVANDIKNKAQLQLFNKNASELRNRAEETAKKALEVKIKADLESDPSKVRALKAEAAELKAKSEMEAKRAEKIKQKAKDQLVLSQFTNVGCFKDDWNRAIPKFTKRVKSVAECAKIAKEADANLFGIQDNGECYIGNEFGKQNFKRYGRRDNCSTLGGPWAQQTYLSNNMVRELNKFKSESSNKTKESEEELRCRMRAERSNNKKY